MLTHWNPLEQLYYMAINFASYNCICILYNFAMNSCYNVNVIQARYYLVKASKITTINFVS